jgi:ribosomal protein L9
MYGTPSNINQFGASEERLEELAVNRSTKGLIKRLEDMNVEVVRHVEPADEAIGRTKNPVEAEHIASAAFKATGLQLSADQVALKEPICTVGLHSVEVSFDGRPPVSLAVNVRRR